MSKLANKLKHRIQIRRAIQTPNDAGGYDRTYETLTTIWSEMIDTNYISQQAKYIRGETLSDKVPTCYFKVRKVAVQNLGKEMASAFSTDFKAIADLMPLKSDYFIFLEQGSTVKGRLFQIMDIIRDERNKEWIKFSAMEIEEHGTGWGE